MSDTSKVGDGMCDWDQDAYNTEACGWDGGDCCEHSCNGTRCGENGYNCLDANFNSEFKRQNNCYNAVFLAFVCECVCVWEGGFSIRIIQ